MSSIRRHWRNFRPLLSRPHTFQSRHLSSSKFSPLPLTWSWPSSSRPISIASLSLATVGFATCLAQNATLALEPPMETPEAHPERVDPDTSIAFPATLMIGSRGHNVPPLTLIGFGVRRVSFLRVKVYSVAFYADLSHPGLKIPESVSPEEKVDYLINNTTCLLRIVPTRNTSYSHLRDGFMRALQSRMLASQRRGLLSQEAEAAAQSPLRKLKSVFPTTALNKGVPLDIILTAPDAGERTLIIRDLGSIQSSLVGSEFMLAYFEGEGLSPPMKENVLKALGTSRYL